MGASKTAKTKKDPYSLEEMSNSIARVFLYSMVFAHPLMMNETKYGAITAFKGTLFYILFICAAVLLAGAVILYLATRSNHSVASPEKLRRELLGAPFAADFALVAYWLAMLISSCFAEDAATAFGGLSPRNNGFVIQTFYIAAYFLLSKGLKPKKTDALIFAYGGAALSFVSLMHFFGFDLYGIAKVNGEFYGGPFYNVGGYKFLGPVGNVNLGSYILTVCCVIAAGLFIAGVGQNFDKYNLITLGCFALTLWGELNINTEAGLVALLAALVVIPIALCTNSERVARLFAVFSVSCGVFLFDRLLVDVILNGKSFSSVDLLLLAGMIVFAAVWAFLFFFEDRFAFSAKKIFTERALRFICLALVAAIFVGGVAASLIVTERDALAAGTIVGSYYKLDAHDYNDHSSNFLEEFGNMLRGNFDDSYGHNRIFTWKRALLLASVRPLFGIGPDNLKAEFARLFKDEAVIMFPNAGGGVDKAHNEYLDVLVCNGAVGLVLYLAFFAALLAYALRRRNTGVLAPVFACAVVAYMAHAFFGYQLPIQSPLMWVTIGMCACFIKNEEPEDAPIFTEEKPVAFILNKLNRK